MYDAESVRAAASPLGTAIASLALPLLAIFASPARAASPGYLYVADYDSIPTTEASLALPISAQTISGSPEHSLFEMSMSNEFGASGNIIEIGVTTDLALNGDSQPHWFVSSWVGGSWKGYDANSDFVSSAGNFWSNPLTAAEGTSENAEFDFTGGNWWLYLNGSPEGYFPGSEWSGAFTQSLVTEVFGEVYWNGTFYPTLNGTISDYASAAGGSLQFLVVDAPYKQSNATATGFTASGPYVPEPAGLGLMGIAAAGIAGRRARRPGDEAL